MYSSKNILELENVSLRFDVDAYRAWTLRQYFVSLFSDPRGFWRKRSSSVEIAKDISFAAKRGERIGILGANGVGKTSLCRCIAGIYRPSAGAIRVQGERRAVFDTGVGLHQELTGRENAELLVDLLFPTVSNRGNLLADALEFSGLGDFLDAPFRLYSNGMRVRLYLSVISAKPCDLFILDEVFDGADAAFAEKMRIRMLKLIEQCGLVLFVSHSTEQIEKICNRVLVMHQGAIYFDGEVTEGIMVYRKLIGLL